MDFLSSEGHLLTSPGFCLTLAVNHFQFHHLALNITFVHW